MARLAGRNISLVLLLSLLGTIGWVGFDILNMNGHIDGTKIGSIPGCICHDESGSSQDIHVWVTGPSKLRVGTIGKYRVWMTGGPAVDGGFNIAVRSGTLEALDSTSYVSYGELTHSFPKPFENDTVSWDFSFMQTRVGFDTIFSVGNSVNGDLLPLPAGIDQWAFGDDFVVEVVDSINTVHEVPGIISSFRLEENYPNPFNPVTNIEFRISISGIVSLKVYDVLGCEVATIVNEALPPGEYTRMWNASAMSSGVYFYRLIVQAVQSRHDGAVFSETKAMVLVR